MPVWAKTADYDSAQVGDDLPILVKHESQETIDLYARLAMPPHKADWRDLHSDPEFAQKGIFVGTVNMGVETVGYVAELLEKAFPLRAILARGARLEMRATEPIRAGDTVTFTGKVTGKRVENGARLVDCELTAVNQLGQTVGVARATVVL